MSTTIKIHKVIENLNKTNNNKTEEIATLKEDLRKVCEEYQNSNKQADILKNDLRVSQLMIEEYNKNKEKM